MISFIRGTVMLKTERFVVVETNGIGYRVFLSSAALATLAEGEEIRLYTHLAVRENETIELYGFLGPKELLFFDVLLNVQGVGPRSALAILGEATVDDLELAIASGDDQVLTRVAGIGKKKAQKIIFELKEKYEGMALVMGDSAGASSDLLDILKKLGYSDKEAREAARHIPNDAATIEEKVKAALRNLGNA